MVYLISSLEVFQFKAWHGYSRKYHKTFTHLGTFHIFTHFIFIKYKIQYHNSLSRDTCQAPTIYKLHKPACRLYKYPVPRGLQTFSGFCFSWHLQITRRRVGLQDDVSIASKDNHKIYITYIIIYIYRYYKNIDTTHCLYKQTQPTAWC